MTFDFGLHLVLFMLSKPNPLAFHCIKFRLTLTIAKKMRRGAALAKNSKEDIYIMNLEVVLGGPL